MLSPRWLPPAIGADAFGIELRELRGDVGEGRRERIGGALAIAVTRSASRLPQLRRGGDERGRSLDVREHDIERSRRERRVREHLPPVPLAQPHDLGPERPLLRRREHRVPGHVPHIGSEAGIAGIGQGLLLGFHGRRRAFRTEGS
jgi:hypothetical protein